MCDNTLNRLLCDRSVKTCFFSLNPFRKLQVDVANYDEIVSLKEKIKKDLGDVDILINNAGVLPRVSLLQGNPEDILRIMKVNLLSHFWVSFPWESLP